MQKVFATFIFAVLLFLSTILIINKLDDNKMYNNQQYNDNFSRFYVYKNYCILPYVSHSEMESNMNIFERITLILHISYNYLNANILEQLESWDGPITLMITIPSANIYKRVRKIKETLSCFPSYVLHRLSAHILFRSKNGCNKDIIDKLNEISNDWKYPANVARNVARMFVRSKYVLISDSQFVFPNGFESRMCLLAQNYLTRYPKTALVVRIFEVNDTIKQMPRNKTELRELFFKGLAVEFHARYNMEAHTIPNLDQWFNTRENKQVHINSIIKFSKRSWEPQFVSLNTIPFHDENFPFSLRDNTVLVSEYLFISQRWEMCRQNYTFALVNDLFMVHRGIKTMHDLPLTKLRQKHSRAQFNIAIKLFKQRMDHHYPETKKSCPEFGA